MVLRCWSETRHFHDKNYTITIVKTAKTISDLFPYPPFTPNRHTFIATSARHSEASNRHFINGRRHFESVRTIVTEKKITQKNVTLTNVVRTSVTQTNVDPLNTIDLQEPWTEIVRPIIAVLCDSRNILTTMSLASPVRKLKKTKMFFNFLFQLGFIVEKIYKNCSSLQKCFYITFYKT